MKDGTRGVVMVAAAALLVVQAIAGAGLASGIGSPATPLRDARGFQAIVDWLALPGFAGPSEPVRSSILGRTLPPADLATLYLAKASGSDSPLRHAMAEWNELLASRDADDLSRDPEWLQVEGLPVDVQVALAVLIFALTDATAIQETTLRSLDPQDASILTSFPEQLASFLQRGADPSGSQAFFDAAAKYDVDAIRGAGRLVTAALDMARPTLAAWSAAQAAAHRPQHRLEELVQLTQSADDAPFAALYAAVETAAGIPLAPLPEPKPVRSPDELAANLQSLGSLVGTPAPALGDALARGRLLPSNLQAALALILGAQLDLQAAMRDAGAQPMALLHAQVSVYRAVEHAAPVLEAWGLYQAHHGQALLPKLAPDQPLMYPSLTDLGRHITSGRQPLSAGVFAASRLAGTGLAMPPLAPMPDRGALGDAVLDLYERNGVAVDDQTRRNIEAGARALPAEVEGNAARLLEAQLKAMQILDALMASLTAEDLAAADADPFAMAWLAQTADDAEALRRHYAVVDRVQAAYFAAALHVAVAAEALEDSLAPDPSVVAGKAPKPSPLRRALKPLEMLVSIIPSASAQSIPNEPTIPPELRRCNDSPASHCSADVWFMDPILQTVIITGFGSTTFDPAAFGLQVTAPDAPGRSVRPSGQILTIDLGGADLYKNNAGGARLAFVSSTTSGTADGVHVDPMAVAAAIDLAGDDTYRTPSGSALAAGIQGAGDGGIGLLWDRRGNDRYESVVRSQGYGAPYSAFEEARTRPDMECGVLVTPPFMAGQSVCRTGPFGIGMLVDGDGNDEYTATRLSQGIAQRGAGGLEGAGLLLDFAGDDKYTLRPESTPTPGQAWSTGGLALLVDAAGDDAYSSGKQGQAAGLGVAALVDLAGQDTYTRRKAGQGSELKDGECASTLRTYSNDPVTDPPEPEDLDTNSGLGVFIDVGPSGCAYDTSTLLPPTPDPVQSVTDLQTDGDADGWSDFLERAGRTDPSDGSQYPAGVPREAPPGWPDDQPYPPATGGPVPHGSHFLLEIPGLVAVGDGGPSTFPGTATAFHPIQIDIGGKDVHGARASTPFTTVILPQGSPVAVTVPTLIVDAGDAGDEYQGGDGTLGSEGTLIDLGGNDVYTAGRESQGFTRGFTSGLLFDRSGDDRYTAGADSHGSVVLGRNLGRVPSYALLLDVSGNDTYSSPGQGQLRAEVSSIDPASSTAMFFDLDGNDVYQPVGRQGMTQTTKLASDSLPITGSWFAAFLDAAGDDTYLGTPQNEDGPDFSSVRNGRTRVGFSARVDQPDPVLGDPTVMGVFVDRGGRSAGADSAEAATFAFDDLGVRVGVPGANWYRADYALLVEPGGSDFYANNAGATFLRDAGRGAEGRQVGAGFRLPVASILIDQGGSDRYDATGAPPPSALSLADELPDTLPQLDWVDEAAGRQRLGFFTQGNGFLGVGILVDDGGGAPSHDRYIAHGFSQGTGTLGVGALWDRQGNDVYSMSPQVVRNPARTGNLVAWEQLYGPSWHARASLANSGCNHSLMPVDGKGTAMHLTASEGRIAYSRYAQDESGPGGELPRWRVLFVEPAVDGCQIAAIAANDVTATASNQIHPQFYTDLRGIPSILWQDDRSGTWDLRAAPLGQKSGDHALVAGPGDQVNPAIHGNVLVWQDATAAGSTIWALDLLTQAARRLSLAVGTHADPSVGAGLAAWRTVEGSSWQLQVHRLSTGETRTIPVAVGADGPVVAGDLVLFTEEGGAVPRVGQYDWDTDSVQILHSSAREVASDPQAPARVVFVSTAATPPSDADPFGRPYWQVVRANLLDGTENEKVGDTKASAYLPTIQLQGSSFVAGDGLLLDEGGIDAYTSAKSSQGFAFTSGARRPTMERGAVGEAIDPALASHGLLVDLDGNDAYRLGTQGQGAHLGREGMISGDVPSAGVQTNFAEYHEGTGMLLDLRGSDTYRARSAAQGFAGLGLGVSAFTEAPEGPPPLTPPNPDPRQYLLLSTGLLADLGGFDDYAVGGTKHVIDARHSVCTAPDRTSPTARQYYRTLTRETRTTAQAQAIAAVDFVANTTAEIWGDVAREFGNSSDDLRELQGDVEDNRTRTQAQERENWTMISAAIEGTRSLYDDAIARWTTLQKDAEREATPLWSNLTGEAGKILVAARSQYEDVKAAERDTVSPGEKVAWEQLLGILNGTLVVLRAAESGLAPALGQAAQDAYETANLIETVQDTRSELSAIRNFLRTQQGAAVAASDSQWQDAITRLEEALGTAESVWGPLWTDVRDRAEGQAAEATTHYESLKDTKGGTVDPLEEAALEGLLGIVDGTLAMLRAAEGTLASTLEQADQDSLNTANLVGRLEDARDELLGVRDFVMAQQDAAVAASDSQWQAAMTRLEEALGTAESVWQPLWIVVRQGIEDQATNASAGYESVKTAKEDEVDPREDAGWEELQLSLDGVQAVLQTAEGLLVSGREALEGVTFVETLEEARDEMLVIRALLVGQREAAIGTAADEVDGGWQDAVDDIDEALEMVEGTRADALALPESAADLAGLGDAWLDAHAKLNFIIALLDELHGGAHDNSNMTAEAAWLEFDAALTRVAALLGESPFDAGMAKALVNETFDVVHDPIAFLTGAMALACGQVPSLGETFATPSTTDAPGNDRMWTDDERLSGRGANSAEPEAMTHNRVVAGKTGPSILYVGGIGADLPVFDRIEERTKEIAAKFFTVEVQAVAEPDGPAIEPPTPIVGDVYLQVTITHTGLVPAGQLEVERVEFFINGVFVGDDTACGCGTIPWPTESAPYPDDSYEVLARAHIRPAGSGTTLGFVEDLSPTLSVDNPPRFVGAPEFGPMRFSPFPFASDAPGLPTLRYELSSDSSDPERAANGGEGLARVRVFKDGVEVARLADFGHGVMQGSQSPTWDGRLPSGDALASGRYDILLEATDRPADPSRYRTALFQTELDAEPPANSCILVAGSDGCNLAASVNRRNAQVNPQTNLASFPLAFGFGTFPPEPMTRVHFFTSTPGQPWLGETVQNSFVSLLQLASGEERDALILFEDAAGNLECLPTCGRRADEAVNRAASFGSTHPDIVGARDRKVAAHGQPDATIARFAADLERPNILLEKTTTFAAGGQSLQTLTPRIGPTTLLNVTFSIHDTPGQAVDGTLGIESLRDVDIFLDATPDLTHWTLGPGTTMATWTGWPNAVNDWPEGPVSMRFGAGDAAGNVAPALVTRLILDRTEPVTVGADPLYPTGQHHVLNGQRVRIEVDAFDPAIDGEITPKSAMNVSIDARGLNAALPGALRLTYDSPTDRFVLPGAEGILVSLAASEASLPARPIEIVLSVADPAGNQHLRHVPVIVGPPQVGLVKLAEGYEPRSASLQFSTGAAASLNLTASRPDIGTTYELESPHGILHNFTLLDLEPGALYTYFLRGVDAVGAERSFGPFEFRTSTGFVALMETPRPLDHLSGLVPIAVRATMEANPDGPLEVAVSIRPTSASETLTIGEGTMADGNFAMTLVTEGFPDGEYEVSAKVSSTVHNVAAVADAQSGIIIIDNTPPALALVSPRPGETLPTPPETLRLSYRDALSPAAPDAVSLRIGSVVHPIAPENVVYDALAGTIAVAGLPPLPAGRVLVDVLVNDAAGNPGAATADFFIDGTAPIATVSVVYPVGQTAARTGQGVTILLAVSDGAGLRGAWTHLAALGLDERRDFAPDGAKQRLDLIVPHDAKSGMHALPLVVEDKAGNQLRTNASISVDVDPPSIASMQTKESTRGLAFLAIALSEPATVSATARSANAEHLTALPPTDVERALARSLGLIASPSTQILAFHGLAVGEAYQVEVTAGDAAGNVATGTLSMRYSPVTVPPPDLADLQAKVRLGAVELSWAAPSVPQGAVVYRVFRSSGGPFVETDSAAGARTLDGDVQPGQSYKYFVQAENQDGLRGTASPVVAVDVPPAPTAGAPRVLPRRGLADDTVFIFSVPLEGATKARPTGWVVMGSDVFAMTPEPGSDCRQDCQLTAAIQLPALDLETPELRYYVEVFDGTAKVRLPEEGTFAGPVVLTTGGASEPDSRGSPGTPAWLLMAILLALALSRRRSP